MNLQKAKIGTLLGIGIVGIISVMVSTTIYLNSLTSSAINIIDESTSRIFDVLTIQRDTEELFAALSDLEVVQDQERLTIARERIDFLFDRAVATLQDGRERQVFEESELLKGKMIIENAKDITVNILSMKEDFIQQSVEYEGNDRGSFYSDTYVLDRQFIKLRNVRYDMLGLVHDITVRSDNDFRKAMDLVGRSQSITWVVVGVSLTLALFLAYFLVRFAKKVYDIKNEFIYAIAHDLRNPVTAILGYLDIIMTGKKKYGKEVGERLKVIEVSANRLRSQINNLLEVGRTESGFVKINLEPVRVSDVIKESVLRAKALAETKGMTMNYEEPEDIKVHVLADRSKLSDVLDNLISNALKYNKEKGSVTIATRDTGGKFLVSVTDTGMGIPRDQKDKIFKKYSRLDTDAEKKVSGTGLGLFTAKLSMEKMKGTITFKTKKGEGTTFTISLHKTKQSKKF